MAQVPPWHSIRRQDRNVFHDDDQCEIGKQIELKYRKMGHRCRVRCPTCARLRSTLHSSEHLARLTPL